jgi:hypothetical protein
LGLIHFDLFASKIARLLLLGQNRALRSPTP